MKAGDETMIERVARGQAEFDGRTWMAMSRVERVRYTNRALLAVVDVMQQLQVPITRYQIGQRVEKHTGVYQLKGEIRSFFATRDGKIRFVVEDDTGFLHIYGPGNIRPVVGAK